MLISRLRKNRGTPRNTPVLPVPVFPRLAALAQLLASFSKKLHGVWTQGLPTCLPASAWCVCVFFCSRL